MMKKTSLFFAFVLLLSAPAGTMLAVKEKPNTPEAEYKSDKEEGEQSGSEAEPEEDLGKKESKKEKESGKKDEKKTDESDKKTDKKKDKKSDGPAFYANDGSLDKWTKWLNKLGWPFSATYEKNHVLGRVLIFSTVAALLATNKYVQEGFDKIKKAAGLDASDEIEEEEVTRPVDTEL